MIIVDQALERREREGRPIRVGMIGCGFMGRGLVNQIVNSVPGMRLVAISNRNPDRAVAACKEAGADFDLSGATGGTGSPAPPTVHDRSTTVRISDDPAHVLEAPDIDCVVEVTGDVHFGAAVVVAAIDLGKHVVTMNAELDGTVGPILRHRATAGGVVLTGCDGDQPGVQMNLVRFVRSIGLTPRVIGNIKGLQDRYRNPTTQESFARKWGQNPYMVTSFADGTKISFEQAIVANATGARVLQRGMSGFKVEGAIDDTRHLWDLDALVEAGSVVDYVVGATPAPGVFCHATHDDPKQAHYLALYKLGDGPLYPFYTPYHLCHFEVPLTVARVVLFGDSTIAPLNGIRVEVITRAKRDLPAGSMLDGLGGYDTYGECENVEIADAENLLPIGLAEGCRLVRLLERDACLTYADVDIPPGRLVDELRREQERVFGPARAGAAKS